MTFFLHSNARTHTVCLTILTNLLFFFTYSNEAAATAAATTFTPTDNYLINCGSQTKTLLDDGRTFKSDPESISYLSTDQNVIASVDSLPNIVVHSPLSSSSFQPLYQSTRIFLEESMYRFLIFHPGRHWIRLYFYPLPNSSYNLTSATFSVSTDNVVLLHDFSMKDSNKMVLKEYLINVTSNKLTLTFSPMQKSMAFINAIEVVSAPDSLISDSATSVSPIGDFNGLKNHALEVSYRLNVGGPIVTPRNDTLGRTWHSDEGFMTFPQGVKAVAVPPDMIKYTDGLSTSLIAPNWIYATADEMADSNVPGSNFNLTWEMNVDPIFAYMIRLHFCDIVSQGLNQLYFNVYINGMIAISNLDLSSVASDLGVPYYKDLVIHASALTNGYISVQVGPDSNTQPSDPNAILNGLEIMKLSNSAGSLDGLFSSVVRHSKHNRMKIAGAVGLAFGVIATLLIVLSILKLKKKKKTFASWLPLNNSYGSFLSSKSKVSNHSSIVPSKLGLGRLFTFNEIKAATKNFDEKSIIGLGGFGKVYIGELSDGIKLAIKRGNASSSQGINEFQTEIEMLSRLRHRHLVSLIGYCDEQSEMILVYEYMANGPLRDHLYGSQLSPLSWRQRLEICIGAARGLHYLHTGSTQGIIHRDVKTTNILLDECYLAKVSDFGLSKAGPSLDQTHVSTAVKGSFGYLDPEYFRRQQLTEKSDVYSFGVVLFEVICARPALDPGLPREQVNLAEWAMQQHKKGKLQNILDPNIARMSISPDSLEKYVEAAEKCLSEYGVDRPSMGDVLWNLEYALQVQDASSNPDSIEDNNSKRDDSREGTSTNITQEKLLVDITDDSGLMVASPLFVEHVQGR